MVGRAAVPAVALAVVSASPAGVHGSSVKVAVVTRHSDSLAVEGLSHARKRLGVDGRAFISKTPADDIRVLSAATQQGYDLVVAEAPSMADALAVVAPRYPQARFAIVGVARAALTTRPGNVRGLVFADQEAGYLAGAAAALASKSHEVSAIGELGRPAGVAFLAGFKAGAQRTVAGTRVRLGTARVPAGASACRTIALGQIGAGSDGVAAGTSDCAHGALQAAMRTGTWGIGVGTGEAFTERSALASVVEQADVAVYATVEDLTRGQFRGGEDALFAIKDGGIAVADISPRAPATLGARLASISAAIGAGKLEPPRK